MSAKIIPIGNTIRGANDLARVIRNSRKARGWTQSEVARRAEVGLRFLSELENGKPTVQLDRTLRVLTALELVFGVYDTQVTRQPSRGPGRTDPGTGSPAIGS